MIASTGAMPVSHRLISVEVPGREGPLLSGFLCVYWRIEVGGAELCPAVNIGSPPGVGKRPTFYLLFDLLQ